MDQELIYLIERARQDDNLAFNELVTRYLNFVRKTIRKMLRNEEDIDDLTQNVFMNAWQKINQLQNAYGFIKWLSTIARRMAINHCKRKTLLNFDVQDNGHADEHVCNNPIENCIRSEHNKWLVEGMRKLKDSDRRTLEAFYLHQQSVKEMAQKFQAPEGTIKRRLNVARTRLREVLENR